MKSPENPFLYERSAHAKFCTMCMAENIELSYYSHAFGIFLFLRIFFSDVMRLFLGVGGLKHLIVNSLVLYYFYLCAPSQVFVLQMKMKTWSFLLSLH